MNPKQTDSTTTNSPRVRRFEMWVSIIGGIYLCSALAVVLFVPHKIRGDIFIPFLLILCGGLVYKQRRLNKIRQEEQKS